MEKGFVHFEKQLYCEKLLEILTFEYSDPYSGPSKEEIEQQIKRPKNLKLPGKYGFQERILKHVDSYERETIYL